MNDDVADARYTMIEERDVFISMRDGVKIAADIFRPDAGGKFPALLAMSPYGKGVQSLPLAPQPAGTPSYLPPIEAGDPAYFTAHGYSHVIVDVRGTGLSEGEYLGWSRPRRRRTATTWSSGSPNSPGATAMLAWRVFLISARSS